MNPLWLAALAMVVAGTLTGVGRLSAEVTGQVIMLAMAYAFGVVTPRDQLRRGGRRET